MKSYQSLGDIFIINFSKITLSPPTVSFFFDGWGGGGGDGVLPVPLLFVVAGEEAAVTASGGDRGVFCFLQVCMSVYSFRFINSIVRLMAVRTDLSMSVCCRNLHHANIAAHECCNLFSSTNDMYSSLVFSSGNCFTE